MNEFKVNSSYRRVDFFLAAVGVLLFITALVFPKTDGVIDSMPIFYGILDVDYIFSEKWLTIPLGLILSFTLLFSFYYISGMYTTKIGERIHSLLFASIFLFIESRFIYFTSIHLVAIACLWAYYFFLVDQKFTAFFLMALSALFYAPMIFFVFIVLVIKLIESKEFFVDLLKYLGGIIIPFIFILSFRFIVYDDLQEFIHKYISDLNTVQPPLSSYSITYLFLILVVSLITIRSIVSLYIATRTKGNDEIYIFSNQLIYLLIALAVYFLFSMSGGQPTLILLTIPLAIFFSNYFKQITKTADKIYLIIFLCAVVIYRLSNFIS